jgi:hypothetical protein
MEIVMKTCYVCREQKPLEEFGLNSTRRDGKQTYCKLCAKTQQQEWYFHRTHGITMQYRDALLQKQEGLCAICKTPIIFDDQKGRKTNSSHFAVVDHCHVLRGKANEDRSTNNKDLKSDSIRGILCGYCNIGLGAFKDNETYLNAAIKYLSNNLTSGDA